MHKAEDEPQIALDVFAGKGRSAFTNPEHVAEAYSTLGQFPHCDPRILHAPGSCRFCDQHPEWQAMRTVCGICFTGFVPDEPSELPDPATHARGTNVNAWHGNRARK